MIRRCRVRVGLMLSFLFAMSFAQEDIFIIHFNDVYEIEPVDRGRLGGAARVATLLDERLDKNPLMLFSGDVLSPSIMSAVFEGAQMIDVFNRLGLDYAVPGNHELDFGQEVATERLMESEFTWVSSNLLDAATGEPYGDSVPWVLTEWNGIQVGLIGLIGDWLDLTNPGSNAEYQDFLEVAQTLTAALKDQGAEVVIALTHMDMADDRILAEQVSGIDLILGGHDHEPMHEVVNNTLIWKTGSDWRTLGELKLFNMLGQKAIILPKYIEVNDSIPGDAEMQAVVDEYATVLDTELGQIIGQTEVALNAERAIVRTLESNFGNLIADASRDFTDADIALMNGGGIRTDQAYGPGELTRRDVQAVLPFGNVLITIELRGEEVLAALENGVSQIEDVAGRFPQVSGVSFSYDPSLPAGQRILEVRVKGEMLDLNQVYTVAINDFIGGGGDGYEMFAEAPRILNEVAGPLLAEVVMNYISSNSPIAPAVEGRITTP